ncbi:acetate/propionate family kinase [Micromonospora echinofusca]|uniref:Acetate kinase n=1 Tax=Micromonospora echinofusca TaxID=47858 RepID=A0ABS3VQ07_MICEH|nr:acetate kinase [Micromonospora echinofusca]MBO4206592.1 acetate/propionate family kinase [Micromonospora echinofusca]
MADRVLVLNCGSSSVKYRLYAGSEVVDGGTVERIGEPGGGPADHEAAVRGILGSLELTGLVAVGHRVVHGGVRFAEPTLIDDAVLDAVTGLVPLAPLHNPANLAGIRVTRELLPDVPQVAVFDTAFHRTLPEEAATYAIELATAERYGIRRYGFHGTSHAYVSRRTAELLGRRYDELNTITLHLGNGASACAVEGGRSVATSMGMSPLEGLVMGTRSGDLDPTIIFHLRREGGLAVDEIDDLLNHRSGLRGLTGVNDMREVLHRRSAGDPAAGLAFDVYCRRIKGYVGAYHALLGRLDAITFTGGVGEHAAPVRAAALDGLAGWGVHVDPERNAGSGDRVVSPEDGAVAVCVVHTDEELEIAQQTRTAVTAA